MDTKAQYEKETGLKVCPDKYKPDWVGPAYTKWLEDKLKEKDYYELYIASMEKVESLKQQLEIKSIQLTDAKEVITDTKQSLQGATKLQHIKDCSLSDIPYNLSSCGCRGPENLLGELQEAKDKLKEEGGWEELADKNFKIMMKQKSELKEKGKFWTEKENTMAKLNGLKTFHELWGKENETLKNELKEVKEAQEITESARLHAVDQLKEAREENAELTIQLDITKNHL